jgi:hypothetical protein
MENPMRDLLLHAAGIIAILVSIAHGVLGEIHVFKRATVEPPRMRTLLRLVWLAGTIAWIAGGVLLFAAPWMQSDAARHWIIATFAVVFGFAAVGNAIATRAVHPGWIGMSAAVALAVAGY